MALLSLQLNTVLDGLSETGYAEAVQPYRLKVAQNAGTLDAIATRGHVHPRDRVASVADAAEALLDGVSRPSQNPAEHRSLVEQNWSTLCWLPAGCIISPRTVPEAALALRLVTYFRASFSVRSNGHLAEPGFSSVGASGVLLDLGHLNQIQLSDRRDTVRVGPGATWDAVYGALETHELTAVGGRIKGVGVAGLILGGGMSHFSNAWGLACDAVRNLEVLVADCTVIQANANTNADLFWALKGGGPNFGIVTRFDLETYPDYKIWVSTRTFAAEQVPRVMQAMTMYQETMEHDENLGFNAVVLPGFVSTAVMHRGHLEEAHAASKIFDGIEAVAAPPPENTTQARLCAKLCEDYKLDGKAKRRLGTLSLEPDAGAYTDFYNLLCEAHEKQDFHLHSVLQPLGKAAVQQGRRRGGNCMNIREVPQTWAVVMAEWTDQPHDEAVQSTVDKLRGQFEDAAKRRGRGLEFLFMNDACAYQDPLRSYGAEAVDGLWAVSRKYDPGGVFQELQNDGFLLSKTATR
ncbi:hypothetical protein JDV02_008958 [Purpureocillium takamizusanense]|uniref:FAD-binding PCMH-type domain-containing protein n=1 Tax=Purpureocillium takamizusanense TaxID=2060973 RepID=A0A9Q8VDS9_9HYPO|nr:uncharacterized protein JDV02_008958 [Purpureocillium takamizusanense]UNI23120.1 hypothetical protein JDV02_008958 [Purpureocillium takamizusanense]